MKTMINENPQKYYYGQTNPMASINPCPLPRPNGTVKTRGITAYDLLKDKPTLKVKRTQKEIQECCRPSFDHPKILHILIGRATGYGAKKLAKMHGSSTGRISEFLKSMGFDRIKPHEVIDKANGLSDNEKEDRLIAELMEAERMSELKSIRKFDERRHWGAQDHPATTAWLFLNRYNSDIQFKIRSQLQCHMRASLGSGKFVSKRLKKALGCTIPEFKEYLERNFLDGMTWENQGGGRDSWQIDHLKPRSWFDQTDPKQFAECWHYTNMQPAWRTHNYRKGNRFGEEKTHNGFQGTLKLS